MGSCEWACIARNSIGVVPQHVVVRFIPSPREERGPKCANPGVRRCRLSQLGQAVRVKFYVIVSPNDQIAPIFEGVRAWLSWGPCSSQNSVGDAERLLQGLSQV